MRRSIAAILVASSVSGCPGTTQTADSGSPSVPQPAATSERALLEPGDFRARFVEVARALRPSVVAVTAVKELEAAPSGMNGFPFDFFFRHRGMPPGHGAPRKQQGTGSGVIIDEQGVILTNNHVVEDADELTVVLDDDTELSATLVGTDPATDLAVIRVEEEAAKKHDLPAAPLGRSAELQVGEWVMAFGAPFGLKQTVSAGIVSAVGRDKMGITDYEDFIQTDAAINPGNSGGPLVNLEGQIVGINTAIASRSGGSQGIGFAIPIDMARQVMKQLVETGSVVRGYIGVFIADVTKDLAASFDFEGRDGVLVQDVSPDGPGAKAGLKPGDIIFELDGEPVDDVSDFRNQIAATAPGTKVKLRIWRDGEEETVTLELGELPVEGRKPGAAPGETEQPRWGLGLNDLTPELRERLALDADQQGAVVLQVQPGSPAQEAGIRRGDVIVDVGGKSVASAKAAQQAMQKAPHDKPLRVRILREGRGLFLILPPPEK